MHPGGLPHLNSPPITFPPKEDVMKRFFLTLLLAGAMSTPVFAKSALDCKQIFLRCAEDCRQIFDISILSDACVFGCYLGYMNCE
jgi:hypothetical protein